MRKRICESIVLYCSDSLIQQTGCDLVTLGCQGKSGGAMAVEGTVGESQLQRIIRDLHGTLPLCVCVYVRVRLVVGSFFLNKEDRRFPIVTSGALAHYFTLGTISQLLFIELVWEMDVGVILLVKV